MGKIVAIIMGLSAAAMAASSGLNMSGFSASERNSGITPATNCVIKGNVSHNRGKRIYHMPGQENYDDTVISPAYGERWFCSEAEARAAGWQKAGR